MNRKLRISILGWAQSVHIQRWVRGLAGRGFDLQVVSLGGEPLPFADTTVFPYGPKYKYAQYSLAAAREVHRFQPDLVHAHYAVGFGLWGMVVNHRPTVVSVWGADIIDNTSMTGNLLVKNVLQRADHVTATSQFLAKRALEINAGLRSRLAVIPFGVNIPAHCAPLPESEVVKLCFIKSLRPKYGPEILIRALAMALEQRPNLSLTMYGDGEPQMKTHLYEITKELGLLDKITFAGAIPHDQIYPALQSHHIMVMPSVSHSESFGVAAVEAAACGRPTIGTRVGGVPEVIRDGETGFLLEPGNTKMLADTIVKLAGDRALQQRMGEAGYRFAAEQYDWSKSLDAMCQLYERLIYAKDPHSAV